MLNQSHFTKPIKTSFINIHLKHVVQCVDEDVYARPFSQVQIHLKPIYIYLVDRLCEKITFT